MVWALYHVQQAAFPLVLAVGRKVESGHRPFFSVAGLRQDGCENHFKIKQRPPTAVNETRRMEHCALAQSGGGVEARAIGGDARGVREFEAGYALFSKFVPFSREWNSRSVNA